MFASPRHTKRLPYVCAFVATLAASWLGVPALGQNPPPEITEISPEWPEPAGPLKVKKIWPEYSYTCGQRPFRLWGKNFGATCRDGMTVKLVKEGEADIVATDLRGVVLKEVFVGRFKVDEGTAAGLWSVVVTNGQGERASLEDAFEVIPECPRGRIGDLYVANIDGMNGLSNFFPDGPCGRNVPNPLHKHGNILQFDAESGRFVCNFAFGGGEGEENQLWGPVDLVWGPNGNLFVSSSDDPNIRSRGTIIEYDGDSGEYVRTFVTRRSMQKGPEGRLSPKTISFGGPNGNLYVARSGGDQPDMWVLEFDRETGEYLRTAVRRPGRYGSHAARMGPDEHMFIVSTVLGMETSMGEYDPVTGRFLRPIIVEERASRHDFLFEPELNTFLVSDNFEMKIDRADRDGGGIVETVVDEDRPYEQGELRDPRGLAHGASGNLFVAARDTWSCASPENGFQGAIHEYDPKRVPFEQVNVFGCTPTTSWWLSPEGAVVHPRSLEFKPIPGDYGDDQRGRDWDVDLQDFSRFAEFFTGPDVKATDALALHAFDRDRDGDLDLRDFAEFQQNFGKTVDDWR